MRVGGGAGLERLGVEGLAVAVAGGPPAEELLLLLCAADKKG
jgi:hypothetical protein